MKNYLIVFVLYFSCNAMNADVANMVKSSRSLLSLQFEYPVIPDNCTVILNDFADTASAFTKCSIKYARPISLCLECIDEYVDFHNTYAELLTREVNGTSCKSLFISHDRLDAVLEYHDSILAIWEKGHCSACFDWKEGKPEISNSTKTFIGYYNETKQCLNFTNIEYDSNNTDAICEKCMTKYIRLDDFYKSLSEDAIGVDSICMDIVDSMNATRYTWSKVLGCCSLRRTPEIIFLCCTAIIASLPLLFYIAVKYCGPIRDLPNVLKQSRFKQMILRSSDAAIN